MNDFRREILEDINWRYSELSILRTIPFRYGLAKPHQEFLIKYSIPIIYSLWEGFVRGSFEVYTRKLNELELSVDEIDINLLTHAISSKDKLNLRNPRTSMRSKIEFVGDLKEYLKNKIVIPVKIPTNSNVSYEVLNDILSMFNLDVVPMKGYKSRLNKLLRFRNAVAHGDNSIPVKAKDVEVFCETVNDLMSEVFDKIDKGYDTKSYLAR